MLHRETIKLDPYDNQRLVVLCGPIDQNLRSIADRLQVEIDYHGNTFWVSGRQDSVLTAKQILLEGYSMTAAESISIESALGDIMRALPCNEREAKVIIQQQENGQEQKHSVVVGTKKHKIEGRTVNQKSYLYNVLKHDLSFAVGPAGTGKTFLSVGCAALALESGNVERIVLTRPAVEAGERLGFLPGGLSEKVDPYLRPLYDALYSFFGSEVVNRYLEQGIIEIAPLAFMRGRTLENSFVILDEAQNATCEQMKMFLTRIGKHTTAVVAGDLTQTDLPKTIPSGLKQAVDLLRDVPGASFTFFSLQDVVRSALVEAILRAYADKG